MTMTIELTEAGGQHDEGYARPRARNDALLLEADRIMTAAFHSVSLSARARFQEAMADSDFRNATFDVLDRETMERYAALPAAWKDYAKTTFLRDFKAKNMVDLLGGMEGLAKVPELTEYPERKVSKAGWTIQVYKRGARFAFSWESWINDELSELESLPEALSIAARETESREGATLLSDGTGPNDLFFNSTAIQGTISNLMTGNPALSLASLTTAINTITSRRDPQGRPIAIPRLVLVVPPALEITAKTIIGAAIVRTQEGTGAGSTIREGGNWVNGMIDVAVEPWLPVIDTSANANTTWYIVPAPSTGRYALAMGFLRGHEEPQVRVKNNQGAAVGGGQLGTTDGSFEIDDIQYRVRHVLGSGYGDPIGTIVSNGSGS